MDFAEVLNDLRREKADKLARARQLVAENKVAEAAVLDGELDALCQKIATTENLTRRWPWVRFRRRTTGPIMPLSSLHTTWTIRVTG